MLLPEIQFERFKAAINALGGPRSAAAAIGVSERTITRLLAGQNQLHAGFLEDTAKALLAHAELCRKLERLISPAFAENLTAAQAEHRPHGNSYHLRRRG